MGLAGCHTVPVVYVCAFFCFCYVFFSFSRIVLFDTGSCRKQQVALRAVKPVE